MDVHKHQINVSNRCIVVDFERDERLTPQELIDNFKREKNARVIALNIMDGDKIERTMAIKAMDAAQEFGTKVPTRIWMGLLQGTVPCYGVEFLARITKQDIPVIAWFKEEDREFTPYAMQRK